MKPSIKPTYWALLAVLILLPGGQQYGGHSRVLVTLDSEPPGGIAFLIPLEKWDQAGGSSVLSNSDALSTYRIGPTPASASAYPGTHVFVVDDGQQVKSETIRVDEMQANRFVIRMP